MSDDLGQTGGRDQTLMAGRGAFEQLAETIHSTRFDTLELKNGVHISAAQCDAAATILRDGPKTVITSATGVGAGDSPVTLGEEHDLPCFIHAELQDDPEVLRLDVGILTGGSYLITRDGEVSDAPR